MKTNTKIEINPPVLRPKDAASYIGVSLPTFWRFSLEDPDFPSVFKLGSNSSAVMRVELDNWLASKRGAVK